LGEWKISNMFCGLNLWNFAIVNKNAKADQLELSKACFDISYLKSVEVYIYKKIFCAYESKYFAKEILVFMFCAQFSVDKSWLNIQGSEPI